MGTRLIRTRGGDLPPRKHLTMLGDIFVSHTGRKVILKSNGWRPDMLLNILQCARQAPTTKNYPGPNVNNAKVKNPCSV